MAIHYAYGTCLTAEKKEIRDCAMGLLLVFLDYKANFLCLFQPKYKDPKQVFCILVECCDSPK